MGSSCCLPTCRPASDGERVCLGQEGGIEEKEGMYCNKLLVSLRYTYIYYAFSPILLYYLYCTIYGSHVRSRASSGSPPSASALRLFFSLLLFLSFPSSSSLLLLFTSSPFHLLSFFSSSHCLLLFFISSSIAVLSFHRHPDSCSRNRTYPSVHCNDTASLVPLLLALKWSIPGDCRFCRRFFNQS